MKQYHKIQSVFKRDEKGKMIIGEYSLPEFEYLKDNIWEFTEKVDGTNIRVYWDGERIIFGGKTDNALIPQRLVQKLQEMFLAGSMYDKFLNKFGRTPVCFYGEGYGAKIQSGGNYRQDQSFVLFDVNINDWWLQRRDVEDIAKEFNIDIVPIIGKGTLIDMVELTRKGFNSNWGQFIAEGIVARAKVELKARSGERIITKIKHKDFK